ncbi:hypothetical protein BLA13014_04053 [Burkholderia aenigmatica]|uniref:Uncharacterized protein n=1 Tax=Burkholderia aenigmatica TaxID=2015348 RepID=A0A6P2N2C4_9BURK|nr:MULTISPECIES: hypothetical protein [Burkholderia]VWB87584.1 hypothetical protein BLA13014_04053 [Burkholderia aenigmatica]
MKKALAALLLRISLPALAKVCTDVFRRKSEGEKPPRFGMPTYYEDAVKWSGGVVRVANSKTARPLVIESGGARYLVPGVKLK